MKPTTPKPYGIGIKTKHGICVYKEYKTLGAAIDALIRWQKTSEERIIIFKHVDGEMWQCADFLNHALNKLEPVVKP